MQQMPYFLSADGRTDKVVGVMPVAPNGLSAAYPAWEWGTRNGRAFVASTTVQTVNSSNYLASVFSNPTGSGKNCYLMMREFASNVTGSSPLEYQAFVNPTVVLTQTAASANMMLNNATASVGMVKWQIATSFTMGGTPASGGFLPVSDEPRELNYLGIITPGTSLGYLIQGAGGGSLQNQARVTMTYFWYEEAI